MTLNMEYKTANHGFVKQTRMKEKIKIINWFKNFLECPSNNGSFSDMEASTPGVTSRELWEVELSYWNFCLFWGTQPPPITFVLILLSSTLPLPMFCIVLLWWIPSLVHEYWDLSRCWLYYITIRLNHHVFIFKSMDLAAQRPHLFYDIAPRARHVERFGNHLC